MARRSIDIRKFVGELRANLAGHLALDVVTHETVMGSFDHALAATLLDTVSPAPAPLAPPVRRKTHKRSPKLKPPAVTETASEGAAIAAHHA